MKKVYKSYLMALFVSAVVIFAFFGVMSMNAYAAENAEVHAEESVEMPAETYILGVNAEDVVDVGRGFDYDPETKTYRYINPTPGWEKAIDSSLGLFSAKKDNLIRVVLANDWVAESNGSFGVNAPAFSAGRLQIPANANIILDLNGKKLNRNLQRMTDRGSVIHVTGCIFTLDDTSPNHDGEVTGGWSNYQGAVVLSGVKKFNFNNGKICGNKSAEIAVGNVSEEVNLNGGVICDNIGPALGFGGSQLNIYGTTITNNMGNGIIHMGAGRISIYGGSISNNGGAGILHSGTGSIVMYGGSITNNKGSGIVLSNGGSFSMQGGSIAGNSCNNGGGGIRVTNGTLQVSGGSIFENSTTGNGGGVYITQPANSTTSVTIAENAQITNNSANIGGGVYIDANSKVNIIGMASIGNNTATNAAAINSNNVFMAGTTGNIYVGGTPKFEANILKDRLINVIASLYDKTADKYADITIHTRVADNNYTFAPALFTAGYSAHNSKDGVALDPALFFKVASENHAVVLKEGANNNYGAGAISKTSSNFSFKADYLSTDGNATTERMTQWGEQNAVIKQGTYGASFVYASGYKGKYSFTHGEGSQPAATLEKKNEDGSYENFAGDISNAGTYKIGYTIDGEKIVFFIIIKPLDISNGEGGTASIVNYSVTATGWESSNGNFNVMYSGQKQTHPVVKLYINGVQISEFETEYRVNDSPIAELINGGTYKLVIIGNGNYTGEIVATEKFVITPNSAVSYDVTWQYFSGEGWGELNALNADGLFAYTSSEYSNLVRIKLFADNNGVEELLYVYAKGVTDYNLYTEDEKYIAKELVLGIKNGEDTIIKNAGDYTLSLVGLPNYAVADSEKTLAMKVAKYNLANIASSEGEGDIGSVQVSLNNTRFDGTEKVISSPVVEIRISNINLTLIQGVDYDLVLKYVTDENEKTVEKILLGGDYKVCVTAKSNNFTGEIGIYKTLTVEKVSNRFNSFKSTGNWGYGTYDKRVNGISSSVQYLYDGTLSGTQREYVRYTIKSGDVAVNETLKRFVSLDDNVVQALNNLNAGDYTLIAEIDETASYSGATMTSDFTVVKGANAWIKNLSVKGWEWNNYGGNFSQIIVTAKHGNDTLTKTLKDGSGNVVEGFENFTEITDEMVVKLKALSADSYTLTAEIEDTQNYEGLTSHIEFDVSVANNEWYSLSVKDWEWNNYSSTSSPIVISSKYGNAVKTVKDADGNVIASLENFTQVTNEVLTKLKGLNAGKYVLTASVDATSDYSKLTASVAFSVSVANNEWYSLSVKDWEWNNYSSTSSPIVISSKYGNAVKTVKDVDGNVIAGLENFTQVTNEVLTKLKGLNAGKYVLTANVAAAPDYSGLTASVAFSVSVANNEWHVIPSVISWKYARYDKDVNYVLGTSRYGEINYSVATDSEGNNLVDGLGSFTAENGVVSDEIANKLTALPIGIYYLIAKVEGSNLYTGLAPDGIAFEVIKAENVWQVTPSVISWNYAAYDKNTNMLLGSALFGEIKYSITKDADGKTPIDGLADFTVTDGVVTDAVAKKLAALTTGTYYLAAKVAKTEQYGELAPAPTRFDIGKAINLWADKTGDIELPSWIVGKYDENINVINIKANYGEVNVIVTDEDGNEYFNSQTGENNLKECKIGKYLVKAWVEGSDNYTGLEERTFTIEVLKKIGLPWWGTTSITLGALALAALIIFILWKQGVFQILTGRIIVAIRTRASIDATIASVRAAIKTEEGRRTVAEAELKEAEEAKVESENN